jgi:hypothetical protein
LLIDASQRVAIIQLDCPKFDRHPVFPALSIRKHIDDANFVQVPLETLPHLMCLPLLKRCTETRSKAAC